MNSSQSAGFHTGCLVATAALIADQVTKEIVLSFAPRLIEGVPVLPGFSLMFGMNPGVSFSMFSDVPWWGLTAFALAVIAGFGVWMWRETRLLAVNGLGLIIGGALGNVVDRFRHGAVVDFLDFHVWAYHWPAFNLADTTIAIGVALLLWDAVRERRTFRSERSTG